MEHPSKGRTGKKIRTYLFYAIGEIALVMIGILLALQVNNWNEERKKVQQEEYLLTALKGEFSLNRDRLLADSVRNTQSFFHIGRMIEILQSSETKEIDGEIIDSLVVAFYDAYSEYDPVSGVINDILNTGKLEVLQNDSLRYLVSQWSGQMIDLRQDYYIREEYFIPIVLPALTDKLPLMNALLRGPYKADVPNYKQNIKRATDWDYSLLAGDQELIGILALHALNQEYVIKNLSTLINYVENTLDIIELEQTRFQ